MSANFLVSVVVPVYNSEEYLAESLDAVIGQSIGFTENIQLILVDDGSTDKSAAICAEYEDRYPRNVRYIKQKNAGVSNARNAGLRLAIGRYVHFFDSDDLLPKHMYRKTVAFMEKHGREVDFVAVKIKFFDAIIDSHPLNYKFTKNGVLHVTEAPDSPILHITTCLFKATALTGKSFDARLKITEDARLISEVLLDKKAYGIISTIAYYYRRRSDGSSAIDGKYLRKDFYQETLQYAYEAMLAEWTDAEGRVAEFMQHTILYDIAYRLDQETQSILTPTEEAQYKARLLKIATSFDDAVIIGRRNLSIDKKVYLLKHKYGAAYESKMSYRQGVYYFDGQELYKTASTEIALDFIRCEQDVFILEGYVNHDPLTQKANQYASLHGKRKPLEACPREQRRKTFLGDVIYSGGAFCVQLPAAAGNIHFNTGDHGPAHVIRRIKTGPYTNLGEINGSYAQRDQLLLRKVPQGVNVVKSSRSRKLFFELLFLLHILADWQLPKAFEQLGKLRTRNLRMLGVKALLFEVAKPGLVVAEAVAMIPRALLLRSMYFMKRMRKKRPLWIVSDRGMAGGDNGEAFFRYAVKQPDCPAEVRFAISKKSKDYERLKEHGTVLDQGSLKYKLSFLLADMVISSHADIETTNPFIRQVNHYVNLFAFDFVFLQHGVIRHDLSSWLNKYEKNIKLFITSAQKEYDSILKYPYYYTTKEVLLSGMPRYDLLESSPQGKLIIAPTYRKRLLRLKTDRYGVRGYDGGFVKSEYYNFYNTLINDTRLHEAMKRASMTGEVYIHPNFAAQHQDFRANSYFTVAEYPYDYAHALQEGSLLVSDYSSIALDFAYLKKPVIYTHFDKDSFFKTHTYTESEFFSDEEDGFGPVYPTYETLVEGIIKNIESGCGMPEKYKARVDAFFYKIDRNNTQRVYDAVVNL